MRGTLVFASFLLASPAHAADMRAAAEIRGTITFAVLSCKRDEAREKADEVMVQLGTTTREVLQPPWAALGAETHGALLKDEHGCERADALLGPSGRYPGVLIPGRDRTRW